ncbi:protein SEEDLING PLASTID DEVELOPMENT 1 [Humulus lupulus]|uniref:protein SEEDLING PLASTID DEVELOPMENT 1 n=1 Tax=Humulus lupulus TaxID=3486 RepID=UPI002B411B31|nr:protein SEEDLING PLASTID DEVELOPMENT 1 [Humulus lupulus]
MLCFPLLQLSSFLTTTQLQNPAFQPFSYLPRKIPFFSLPKCLSFSSFSHFPNIISSGHPRIFLGSYSSLCSSGSSSDDDLEIELNRLLALLPEEMRVRVNEHPELHQLIEVVMDLGRKPLARFPSGDFVLSDSPITVKDLEYATSQVGDFAIDNRAGISRTLHRISAVRNRKGAIIGLTCRVGRAISGSANLLRYLVQDGSSLLLIGPPGVGKTTIIREIARMLANDYKKRVMIVDTSNEIGGDGDIPHAGIGNARRMQVPNSDLQHEVLIEAVENHMPQVIVIDEIGTKLEAMAASTIAQRGIQLVATAHGVTIKNLIMNPSLEMLVGGIQSVTLGDEEASRRGVQKSVLERKGPATFSCAVEIVSKTELRVHRSLDSTVDAILAGRHPYVEVRKINSDESGETLEREPSIGSSSDTESDLMDEEDPELVESGTLYNYFDYEASQNMGEDSGEGGMPLRLFVYGILEASVTQGIKQLKIEDNTTICLTNNISEADAVLALQSKLKKNPRIQAAFKSHNIPIYMTKTSSLVQIRKVIRALLSDHEDGLKDFGSVEKVKPSEKTDALEEARLAIEQVVIPKGEPVELLPRSPRIISLQFDLIRKYQLEAEQIGSGAETQLRILPFGQTIEFEEENGEQNSISDDDDADDFVDDNGNSNGSPYLADRLPLLPE